MFPSRSLTFLLAMSLAFPAYAQPTPAEPPSVVGVIPAERLPASSSVLLASLPVRVTPARETTFLAPLTGELTLLVPPDTRELTEGTLWGEVERERTDLDARALDLAAEIFKKREQSDWHVQQFQDRSRTEDRLNQIAAEKALLDRIGSSPELTALYFKERAGSTEGLTAEEMRRRLDDEEKLLRQRLDYVGSNDQIDLEIGLQKLKLEQQRFDFERRIRSTRLTAPFDGELRLLLRLRPDRTTYTIEAGQEIARMQDTRRILVQVPIAQASLRNLPVEHLEVRLGGPRSRIVAKFLEREVVSRMNREELLYIFEVPPAQAQAARSLIGGAVQGELWFDSNEPLHLARKLHLAVAAPDTLREEGWPAVVETVYPGWRLVCTGQHQLGLARAQ